MNCPKIYFHFFLNTNYFLIIFKIKMFSIKQNSYISIIGIKIRLSVENYGAVGYAPGQGSISVTESSEVRIRPGRGSMTDVVIIIRP